MFGRKIVCTVGFLLIAIALFLYPFARIVYPNLLLLRLIFSNGICAVTTQPLLADYVRHDSKGFAGGITSFFSGVGALAAVFGLMNLRSIMSYGEIYIIAGGISLFVAIFCSIGVKNITSTNSKACKDRL